MSDDYQLGADCDLDAMRAAAAAAAADEAFAKLVEMTEKLGLYDTSPRRANRDAPNLKEHP